MLPREGSEYRHTFTSQSWVLMPWPGQGRAAALKGQGLGGGTHHGPAPSHLWHAQLPDFKLSTLMEQKRTSTSKRKSLT